MDEAQGALTQLRAYLAQQNLNANAQLPPEREFCEVLGVSRGELRKALAVLERMANSGAMSARALRRHPPLRGNHRRSGYRRRQQSPEVMHARLAIEPVLAREAALNARPPTLPRCASA